MEEIKQNGNATRQNWNSPESTPVVPIGTEKQYWIAIKTSEGKECVFIAHYQNRPLADEGDDEAYELIDLDGEPIESVGWVDCKEHSEFDNYYTPISFNEHYELLGWAECIAPTWNVCDSGENDDIRKAAKRRS